MNLSVKMTHSSNGTIHMIVETKNVPTAVTWTQIEHSHVKTVKNVCSLILSIGGSDGRLKSTSQVVEIESGGRFGEVRTVEERC